MTEDTILSIESSDQGENIVISNARVQHNGRRLLIRAQRGRRKRPWIGPSVIDWWVITNWNNVLTYPPLLNTTCPMLCSHYLVVQATLNITASHNFEGVVLEIEQEIILEYFLC